jgi:hypothetical protein
LTEPAIFETLAAQLHTNMRKSLALGLLALAGTAFIAQGSIGLQEPSIAGSNGNFTWNYSGTVFSGETVTTGSFFTIYDFGSITPGSNSQPAGWTLSTNTTGITPIGTPTVKDNPAIPNLTWTYNGPSIVGNNTIGNLGTFSVITNTNQVRDGEFAAQATSSNQGSADFTQRNVGVPVPEASTLLPIVSVCGAAVAAGIPSFLRRRRKSR